MEIIIHRGAKQIGGTCIEIRSDQTRLIFDIGEELPETNKPEKVKTRLSVDDLFIVQNPEGSTTSGRIIEIIALNLRTST